MKIEEFSTVSDHRLIDTWRFYQEVFSGINALAANRHLMTRDEFESVMADVRVQKWMAFSDDGEIFGMATITRYLEAWPLVSPQFFAQRYPSHYERQAIWYIGMVGCSEEGTREHAFRELVTRMYPQVVESDGIFVFDFCVHNVSRKVPDATRAMLLRINPTVEFGCIDAQEFWAGSFAPHGVAAQA